MDEQWNISMMKSQFEHVKSLERPAIRWQMSPVTADDVTIEIADDQLVVRGERSVPEAHDGTRYVHRERAFGAFERHLTLPAAVDPDTITAAMEHGVLSLLIAKPERPAPQRIAIGPQQRRRFSPGSIAAELLRAPKE
jgi:HSP20 family molecular chaperone IbpA